ncbi:MAG: PfkB family carbohydrate kinase, partial [Eubacteriales bacterium]|nr:PfkB family carbohydrate kinase [Eubacteriales bacterium]
MLIDRGARMAFVTLGSKGAVYANAFGVGLVSGFKAKVVDTTGAGDCFTAGALYRFLQSGKSLDGLTQNDVCGFADFACAAASICVEGKGGIPSMPSLSQVEQRQNGR